MRIMLYFFTALVYIVFTQNIVFTGGYGISESIRTAARPKQILLFSVSITYFTTVTSLICRLFSKIDLFKSATATVNVILFTVVLAVLYFLTIAALKPVLKRAGWEEKAKEKLFDQAGVSAFNTVVLSVPFIGQKAAFTISESIGAGIGAGCAFALATLLINEGMKKIEENDRIPDAFKGIPALFLYIAVLAMAFTGVTGKSLFL